MAKKFDFLSPGIEMREIDQSFIPSERDAEGPIIIGRTRKGPANKPVKIRNLDDFVSVFGAPVPGGTGQQGDIWREGNTIGPTYAAYAAQAWLASEESPITMVRLAGEQHTSATAAGYAGWQVNSKDIDPTGNNATAYGLFMCDSTDAAQGSTIVLQTDSGFSAAHLELDNSKAVTIQFVQRSSLGLATTLGAVGTGDGLKFEIDFDDDTVDVAAGAIARATDGTGGVAKITCGINGYTTATQVMSVVALAIQSALDNGDITDISVIDNGDGTVNIISLDTSNYLLLGESVCGEKDQFKLTAAASNGIEDDSDGAMTDQSIRTNTAGWAGAEKATVGVSPGSLAAVFYCVTGALALNGKGVGESGATAFAGDLKQSLGTAGEFKLDVYNESGVLKESVNFNMSRGSSKYIRNVFNTNPQLTNSTMIDAADLKTYWLGESFVRHLEENVTVESAAAEATYAILMPLGTGTTAATNWGYQRKGATEAKSGWVISQKTATGGQTKLFRLKCLHVGEDIQKNYMIAIEDIKEPTNPNIDGYGSFTVSFLNMAGQAVERYSNLSLNPSSPNYIAKRIGDQYLTWSDSDKRYRTYGDFKNQSDLFYVEMNDVVLGGAAGLLPVGFHGPVRPVGFGLKAGDTSIQDYDIGGDHANPVVQSGDNAVIFKGQSVSTAAAELRTVEAVQFQFPKLALRANGEEGGAGNEFRVYWGIRPKLSTTSDQNDPDYCDYLRSLGMGLADAASHVPTNAGFEYSFKFSLDDIVHTAGSTDVAYTSGSYTSGTSYTATGGQSIGGLLDLNVRQFLMPVWGGSEGLDIKEMEPFRNSLIDSTLSPTTNYVEYSISKALDSVSDAEVVPANLLVVPGIHKPAITNKMITLAEQRKDMLAVIDIENDYVPRAESKDSASTRLGSVSSAVSSLKARYLNSSYACCFYPWVQLVDNINGGQYVWAPPSVAALGAFGKSQAQADVWFAPAGFNRGGLGTLGGSRGPAVVQARQRLDSNERDSLYEVNINPIATFPAEGLVIFGQKTLQAGQSALDRINVRRLLLYLKSRVSTVSRNLLFDNNVPSTWARFESQVNPILSDVKARFGLTDYRLILDETTTTADLIDRNVMYAKIFIKPARAIEYIVVDFVITRTGADFV